MPPVKPIDREDLDYGVLTSKSGLPPYYAELLLILAEIRDALKGGR